MKQIYLTFFMLGLFLLVLSFGISTFQSQQLIEQSGIILFNLKLLLLGVVMMILGLIGVLFHLKKDD